MWVKQFLILQLERSLYVLSKHKEDVRLPIAVSENQPVLICLPEKSDNQNQCQALVLKYQALFLGRTILFCAPADQEQFITSSCKCLYYSSESLSIPGKLNPVIQEVLHSSTYRLAIDLNQDLSLPAALICKRSGAKTRISFEKPHARLFYNVLFRPDESSDSAHLTAMKNYLQSIIQIVNSEEVLY